MRTVNPSKGSGVDTTAYISNWNNHHPAEGISRPQLGLINRPPWRA
jgi:hypothetical protein